MAFVRRQLPLIIFAVCSLFLIGTWFLDYKPLLDLGNRIMQIGSVATAFALTLGGINLIKRHSNSIIKRRKGEWYWSLYLLVLFIPLTLLGLVYGPEYSVYNWLYLNVNTPLDSAMRAILAPYIATAAYRAFKLKNRESLVVTLCCVFVLLQNAPVGEAIWSGFPLIGQWVSDYLQNTGLRVFTIGIALGTIALFIRTLRGKETASLGFGGEE